MNVTIIVPSERYLDQAGARIRYRRIEPHLHQRNWKLRLLPIDQIDGLKGLAPGILLFSKCQDARATALAAAASEQGYRVGIDLFDDYFSQVGDARFAPQRHWLAQMAPVADFYLCSTDRMGEVASRYMPDKSGLVLNDPFDCLDIDRLAIDLARKRDHATSTRTMSVLWFGIGDNPNFPVGLEDLAGQSDTVNMLRRSGFNVHVTVLTNERALDAHGLGLLRRLAVPFTVKRWSVEAEQAALQENFLSFIPVNSQPFSIAKSLNRAVSALTGATQLLSSGYPLYSTLSDFVYRDAAALLRDLNSDALKLRKATTTRFARTLDAIANPEREASELAEFLDRISGMSAADSPKKAIAGNAQTAILHGFKTHSAIHQFALKMGWLSLATPFAPGGIQFDAHLGFFGEDGHPALRLSKRAHKLLLPRFKRMLESAPANLGKGGPNQIPLHEIAAEFPLEWFHSLGTRSMGERIANRHLVAQECRHLFGRLFGDLAFVESELDAGLQAADATPLLASG